MTIKLSDSATEDEKEQYKFAVTYLNQSKDFKNLHKKLNESEMENLAK